jgi:glycosyltransferase involved in cell wall biosynthesis
MKVASEKVHNIFGGVNANYRPASSEKIREVQQKYHLPEHFILFVGSDDRRKNLVGALRAYLRLLKDSPLPQHLVIVGPKQARQEETLTILQDAEIAQRVHFIGYVDVNDLPAVYSDADLFIFPSLYEGFGLPVLESMACGTPVITSNGSSLPEVVGDAALIVNPYQTDELVNAMRLILTDAPLKEQLRVKGLAHAKSFTWQTTAQSALHVYQSLLNS